MSENGQTAKVTRRVMGHPWLWHALFDGSRLCRCQHSRWYRGEVEPEELFDADGRFTGIAWHEVAS